MSAWLSAWHARKSGLHVQPVRGSTADGLPVAAFVCGVAPVPGSADKRHVELFIATRAGHPAEHYVGLPYAVALPAIETPQLYGARQLVAAVEQRMVHALRAELHGGARTRKFVQELVLTPKK